MRGYPPPTTELLLYSENRVLCHLGNSEFEHGLGWNPDLLLRLGIKTRARLPLLFDQLAKAGQNEFAVLFDRFVNESAERIKEYSSGLLIGLGCFSKSKLKFCFERYGSGRERFQGKTRGGSSAKGTNASL